VRLYVRCKISALTAGSGELASWCSSRCALAGLGGAMLGAKTLSRMSNVHLKKVFVPMILPVALSMLAHGLSGM